MSERNFITCDVIKDLLPSYIDGICSEDSRKLVAEHISDCVQCKQSLDILKNTMFSTEKVETEQINYMKKVKLKYNNKSMMGFRLFALLICAIIFSILYGWYNIDKKAFYVFEAIMIVGAYFILPKYIDSKKTRKLSNIFSIISIIMILCVAVLMQQSWTWITNGYGMFGMDLVKVGPFLVKLLLVNFSIQFLILASCMVLPFWNINVKRTPAILSIIGSFIVLIYIYLLYNMSTPERYIYNVIKNIIIIAIEGAVITAIAVYCDKFLHKR